MSQWVKNGMVAHVAQRTRENACLFTFVLDDSEVERKLEGHLKGISDFLQLGSCSWCWPSALPEAGSLFRLIMMMAWQHY